MKLLLWSTGGRMALTVSGQSDAAPGHRLFLPQTLFKNPLQEAEENDTQQRTLGRTAPAKSELPQTLCCCFNSQKQPKLPASVHLKESERGTTTRQRDECSVVKVHFNNLL